jgi:hypothetical protein
MALADATTAQQLFIATLGAEVVEVLARLSVSLLITMVGGECEALLLYGL